MPTDPTESGSAFEYATTRTRAQARSTAIRTHPLWWMWRRIRPRRGLSARYEPPTDPNVILERLAALPLSLWTYGFDDPTIRHLGPMSQDFAAAFGLGWNDRALDMVDCNGVLSAAIQALHKRVVHLEHEVAALRGTAK